MSQSRRNTDLNKKPEMKQWLKDSPLAATQTFESLVKHLCSRYIGSNQGYRDNIQYAFNGCIEGGYIVVVGKIRNTVIRDASEKGRRIIITTIENENFITNEEYKRQTFEHIDNYLRNIESFHVPAQQNAQAIVDDIENIPADISATEREALITIRVGQGVFRQQLLDYWKNSCSVTGCRMPSVLIASHIKPWRDCNGAVERLDVMNGLLLIPTLDALFDKGFISFDDNGKIIISSQLSNDDLKKLGVNAKMKLRETPNKQRKAYLEYHREHILSDE